MLQFVSLISDLLDDEGNFGNDDVLVGQLLEYGSRLDAEWHGEMQLKQAFELIGYSCPKSSRYGSLFKKEWRVEMGERVNSAMLEGLG